VHAHADFALATLGPGVAGQCPLSLHGGAQATQRSWKDRKERITLGIDFDTTVIPESFTQQIPVTSLQISIAAAAERMQQPGRAFYISQQ
jgi:hypothetical protein